MLKPDGVLCSFSPCIEQVQRACDTLMSKFTGMLSCNNFHSDFRGQNVFCLHILLNLDSFILSLWPKYSTWVLIVDQVTDGYLYMYLLLVLDIRTFEVLLRTYEVQEVKMDCSQGDGGGNLGSLRRKRQRPSGEGNDVQDNLSSPTVMARPCSEAKGHTGYLTFARLKCLS